MAKTADILALAADMVWDDLLAIKDLNKDRKHKLLDSTTAARLAHYVQKFTPLLKEEREAGAKEKEDLSGKSPEELVALATELLKEKEP